MTDVFQKGYRLFPLKVILISQVMRNFSIPRNLCWGHPGSWGSHEIINRVWLRMWAKIAECKNVLNVTASNGKIRLDRPFQGASDIVACFVEANIHRRKSSTATMPRFANKPFGCMWMAWICGAQPDIWVYIIVLCQPGSKSMWAIYPKPRNPRRWKLPNWMNYSLSLAIKKQNLSHNPSRQANPLCLGLEGGLGTDFRGYSANRGWCSKSQRIL